MTELDMYVDGHFVHTMRGDGLIVGTPTGSTAYLMSTGAPLVAPSVDCLIASPLNEYSFSSRPMILSGQSKVKIILKESHYQDVVVVIDGGERLPLHQDEYLVISKSVQPAFLVAFEPQYFFKNLKQRLKW